MAIAVKTYGPQCFVTIIAKTFSGGTYTGTTQYLATQFTSSLVQATVHRSLNSVGSFELTFKPTRVGPNGQTWYELIHAMDYVEIATMAGDGSPRTTIMRGFVSGVAKTFHIAGGTPGRYVIITGQDYGKIAMQTKLYSYADPVQPTVALLNTWASARLQFGPYTTLTGGSTEKPAQSAERPYTPTTLISEVFNGFLTPTLGTIRAAIGITSPTTPTFPGISLGVDPALTADHKAIGLMSYDPILWSNNYQPGTSIWDVFQHYQNAPWCELFFDDIDGKTPGSVPAAAIPTGQYLIYRNAPWRNINGGFIQPTGSVFGPIALTPNDIIAENLAHSDEDVLNFIDTINSTFGPETLPYQTIGVISSAGPSGAVGSGANPTVIGGLDYPAPETGKFGAPSSFRIFGMRENDFATPYFSIPAGQTLAQVAASQAPGGDWDIIGRILNQRLVSAFGFNELLEAGSITIHGRGDIHIGDYVTRASTNPITAALSIPDWYYVQGVTHLFLFPQEEQGTEGHYQLNLEVSRGEGFLHSLQVAGLTP